MPDLVKRTSGPRVFFSTFDEALRKMIKIMSIEPEVLETECMQRDLTHFLQS